MKTYLSRYLARHALTQATRCASTWRFLLLALIAATLSGCGGGGDDGSSADDQIRINPPHCAASAPSCV